MAFDWGPIDYWTKFTGGRNCDIYVPSLRARACARDPTTLLLAVIIARAFRVLQDITHPKYKLHSSVILDFGTILYIRNNKARFTELTLANNSNYRYARDNYIQIEAYRIIEVIM